VVSQVQTPGRCCRFLLSFPNRLRKKVLTQRDFYGQPVFVAEGAAISERRRLCDAKIQSIIPGAQPSSPISEVVGTRLRSSARQRILPDLHSMLGWTTILSDYAHRCAGLRRLRSIRIP